MRKLLLGVALVLLIIGVSYLKAVKDENQRADAARQMTVEATAENVGLKQSIDSLQTEADRSRQQFDDSLWAIDQGWGEEIDSLHAAIADRDANLDSLRKLAVTTAATDAKAADTKAVAAREDKNKTFEFHRKVLAYYKKRHDDLPGDLTTYEQRVALSEIRTETARRFNISVGKLNQIRIANNLDF